MWATTMKRDAHQTQHCNNSKIGAFLLKTFVGEIYSVEQIFN
jgi:hypothetical protein